MSINLINIMEFEKCKLINRLTNSQRNRTVIRFLNESNIYVYEMYNSIVTYYTWEELCLMKAEYMVMPLVKETLYKIEMRVHITNEKLFLELSKNIPQLLELSTFGLTFTDDYAADSYFENLVFKITSMSFFKDKTVDDEIYYYHKSDKNKIIILKKC